MKKNYACQRLYTARNAYLKLASVCIDQEGRVLAYRPLTNESAATEWIGGVIFLSADEQLHPASHFDELRQDMPTGPMTEAGTLYAWHVSNFDFTNEDLTPQSCIQRLHAKSIITL